MAYNVDSLSLYVLEHIISLIMYVFVITLDLLYTQFHCKLFFIKNKLFDKWYVLVQGKLLIK